MAAYVTLTTTRPTPPDPVALQTAVKSATGDATAVLVQTSDGWRGKKVTPWTPSETAAAQNALDTVAPLTAQLDAQHQIDAWPIAQKALVIAITKQFNVIRSKLSPPLPDLTKEQVLAAIRNEAGSL